MKQLAQVMMQLIAQEACGIPMEKLEDEVLSDVFFEQLYRLSKSQDLAHLVGAALAKQNVMPAGEIGAKFEKQMFTAAFRYQRLNYEYTQMCALLEREGIAFLPLKGSVIRDYYPEPWMRTSCDIDILVHEEDLNRASLVLQSELAYRTDGERGFHDISLFSPSGIHLELHFNILEDMESIDRLLQRVWEYSSPVEGMRFAHRQSNEYLVFHIVAHMSYHFVHGGCGVRPFLDLYLLTHRMGYDGHMVRDLCRSCDLEPFFQSVCALSEAWFGGAGHSSLTLSMEDYLLRGGIYGSKENVIAATQEKKGGKRKYIMKRIFMPYEDLKKVYPVLEKHKWLTPVCHLRRLGRILFRGGVKRSVSEIKTAGSMDRARAKETATLFSDLGL